MGWRRFFRRRYWDEERAREIEAYLELEASENKARGMSPEEARYAAHRKFGNATQVREEIYRMNTIGFLETLWQDLRYGARLLRLNPGFALVALLSLALGIGANTAIFQLLDSVRLSSLPVSNPQELATVHIVDRHWASGNFTGRYSELTYALWEQIRERQQAFSGIFAWGTDEFRLGEGGDVQFAEGIWVSGEFFNVLGVQPLLGRLFTPDDDQRGCGSPGAVLSYAFWQRRFGGETSVVGRKLMLQGHPFEIVGVTPANFFGVEVGHRFDVAIPVCSEPILHAENPKLDKRHYWWLATMGRLKPGWSVERANAHIAAIGPTLLEATIPPVYPPDRVKRYLEYKLGVEAAGSGFSSLRQTFSAPLWLLLGIAGLVLLIACANLANLMLARASARQREIAVRLALGASRGRLVRQLLSESLLLAAAGAAAGAFLARSLSRFLVDFLSTEGSRLFVDLSLDWRVLAFTTALAMLTCLLFGLTPAVRATSASPGAVMKAAGRGMTAGRERFSLRRALVVSQVALSCVLLVTALLFVRSLRNLVTLDAGFRQDGILIASADLTPLQLAKERREVFKQDLIDRVNAIPGVEATAANAITPISDSTWTKNVLIGAEDKGNALVNQVTPGYFNTLEIPLLAGRDFDQHDDTSAPLVAVVNEMFAEKFLPETNPIGATFRFDGSAGEVLPTFEIIGLVRNTKYRELRDELEPIVFLPALQDRDPDNGVSLVIRAGGSLDTLLPAVKDTIAKVSPAIPVRFRAFKTQILESLMPQRLMATLSGFFGLLAVLLATVGLYGVMSYVVARRRNEIGIRMALGAGQGSVVAMILREAGWLVVFGLAIGMTLAVGAARVISGMLFGLEPNDPLTLATAAAGLAAVALAASFLPARRAAKLNPTVALREE
jgi:putative ABC transport system permease protein